LRGPRGPISLAETAREKLRERLEASLPRAGDGSFPPSSAPGHVRSPNQEGARRNPRHLFAGRPAERCPGVVSWPRLFLDTPVSFTSLLRV